MPTVGPRVSGARGPEPVPDAFIPRNLRGDRLPDYHEKCPNVADLALCKERLESYADDEALKKDVRQIALNSSTYHGPASPLTQAADDRKDLRTRFER